MAIKPFNSVAGFSIGEAPSANIILANGDITTTNITLTGVSNLNSIGNVRISGGTVGQVISTDGAGNLSFVTISTAGLSNGTSNIAVLNNGNITFSVSGNANVGIFTDTGLNVAGTLNATGNANVGNISAARGAFTNIAGEGGNISNIQGANVSGAVASATSATTAGTVTTAAQPNITSVGTLTSLGVNGTVTAVAFTANTGIFTGNGSGLSAIAGANVTGTVASATTATTATTAGTVTTAAQPNITSVGTLTGLSVNGTITGVNITANTGIFTGNGSALTALNASNISTGTLAQARLANSNVILGSTTLALGTTTTTLAGLTSVTSTTFVGALTGAATTAGTVTTAAQPNITSVGTLSSLNVTGNANVGNIGAVNAVFTGTGSFGGNVAMGNFNITGLATPTNPTDAATKEYVDEVAQGLKARTAADAYSSTNLVATYNNGASGVGATLTATTNGAFPTIDGVTLNTTTARRLLVAGQTNAAHNGLYVLIDAGSVSTPWVLRRCVECDTAQEIPGSYVFINGGTTFANTGWVATVANASTFVVGTDAITWVQFSGAGTYTAGTGLTLTGSVFSVNAAQSQITSVGTLTGLSVNGNVVAANITANTGVFTGNGSALTALNASNLSTGTVPSARLSGSYTIDISGSATTAGTVTTNAQPNITSVGTLSSLAVTGNANVGNLNTARVVATGNISGTQLISNIATGTAPLVVTSTTQVANLNAATAGSATTAGTVTTAAQPNITSVGTLSSLSVTGNVSTGNISGTNGNLTTANISGSLILGNSSVTTAISYGSVTTTAITANQTIASFSTTGVTGVEFLVKSIDSAGSKYGVATVVAVTDGTSVDYSTFATVNLGGYTGALAVNIGSGQVRLQVTPASSNSTVWTTQMRLL
jgi:hypothetical protein